MSDLTSVDAVVLQGIADRVFPGAVYAIGLKEQTTIRALGRFMYTSDSPPITDDTLWDLASLSKVIGCTTAAMLLSDDGKLKLNARVAEFLPAFAAEGK